MSQSATLYRVSQAIFRQLEQSIKEGPFDIDSAKSYTIFQGSFMGLEFILSKGQDASTAKLVSEIFNPSQSFGGEEFKSLASEDRFDFYESGKLIPYLDIATISKLDEFLGKVSETGIDMNYDSKELNNNGIYPEVWHDDNAPNTHIINGISWKI
ncbi:DUF1877 family protein [Ferruginibacter paludis]|uniref:DUF1877 family protein n=1 Tax=Ferruginibacter paludis TaxID=1310417 RepID=UPI0025B2894B|nr:DUF1877 family protein [Ferruginibacter paludis]MDN3659533.1 DUF1877 family protein [Ferruginibacter paludis]